MANLLDTFITRFKFETDRTGLHEVTRGLNAFKTNAIRIGASIFSILSGGLLLGGLAKKADEMGKFADSIGISVQQLQELQFAAERSGVSVSSLRSSLMNLNKVVGQAARGYGVYGQVLGRFGVAIRNQNGQLLNTFQLLKELNVRFQELSTAQQFDLAQNLGLNPETIKLLQQTPAKFDNLIKRSKELGLITKKNTLQAAKFEDSLTDLKAEIFELGIQLAAFTFPILEKGISILIGFGKETKKFSGLIKAAGIAIVGVLVATKRAFIAEKIAALDAWVTSLLPIAAVVAAITGVVLIVQDIWAGFHGGKSVIFSFIEQSKTIQKVWSAIKTPLLEVADIILEIINAGGRLVQILVEGVAGGFVRAAKAIHGFFSSSSKKVSMPNAAQLSPTLPAGRAGSGSVVSANKSVSVNVGDINIHTNSSDPQQIGNIVTDHIKNQFKNSVHMFDSSVKL